MKGKVNIEYMYIVIFKIIFSEYLVNIKCEKMWQNIVKVNNSVNFKFSDCIIKMFY